MTSYTHPRLRGCGLINMVDLEEEQDSKLTQKTEQDWYIDIGEGQVINNIYLFIYNSFNIRSKAVVLG